MRTNSASEFETSNLFQKACSRKWDKCWWGGPSGLGGRIVHDPLKEDIRYGVFRCGLISLYCELSRPRG
jgi:hypothetical protein